MKLLITSLLVIPLIVLGQNPDTIKTKRIAIGLTFSPDYCYHVFKSASTSSQVVVREVWNEEEIPKFGFTSGINVAFRISKTIALETGVLYAGKGYKTKEIDLASLNVNWQTNGPNFATKIRFISHFHYIDIPIRINYYLFVQKLKFYITAGVSPNIFLGERGTSIITYRDGSVISSSGTSLADYKRINLVAFAGFGFSWDLTSNFYLKTEPLFRRSVTSINDAPSNNYLYSPGLNTGIYYKL